MLILAVTGAIYLFNDEINDALYPQQRFVQPAAQSVPLSRIMQSVMAVYPGGRVTRIDTPRAVGRSAEIFVRPQAGEPFRVYVDPGTGAVLGSFVYTSTLVGFADVAHGSLMLENFGDGIVELAACWGFILTVTGLYLWWPRGRWQFPNVLLPKWNASGRRFLKSLHSTIGLWTALLIMFLIITGLPWANLWGDMLRRGANLADIGYPASFRGHSSPSSETVKDATGNAGPWTVNEAPIPHSDLHADHHGTGSSQLPAPARSIGVDQVAAILAREGMTNPYRLNFPKGATGVFTAFVYPDQPESQRTLYVDQYSGRVLGEIRFSDYGWVAKAVELGVQIHMGNYFGLANQILMLIPCLGVIGLSITGPYMWWRRRPKGQLAAPRAISPLNLKAIAFIVFGLGLIFPLAGASLLVVLVIDQVVRYAQARLQF